MGYGATCGFSFFSVGYSDGSQISFLKCQASNGIGVFLKKCLAIKEEEDIIGDEAKKLTSVHLQTALEIPRWCGVRHLLA
jgi:hypothetical protein